MRGRATMLMALCAGIYVAGQMPTHIGSFGPLPRNNFSSFKLRSV